jgi:hypothetical protein
MRASSWFQQLSTAGRLEIPAPVSQQWDTQPQTQIVERFENGRWVAHKLTWDGQSYTEVKSWTR